MRIGAQTDARMRACARLSRRAPVSERVPREAGSAWFLKLENETYRFSTLTEFIQPSTLTETYTCMFSLKLDCLSCSSCEGSNSCAVVFKALLPHLCVSVWTPPSARRRCAPRPRTPRPCRI